MLTGRCDGSTAFAPLRPVTRADVDIVALVPSSAETLVTPAAEETYEPVPISAQASTALDGKAGIESLWLSDAAVEPHDDSATVDEPIAPKQRPWIVRHWALPVVALMLVAAYLTLRDHLPGVKSIADAFSTANLRWLTVAVVLEYISNAMFARQQRALLRSLGVRMSMARALAVTYARSALAISVPAGSAVSAGSHSAEYKRGGANTEKATAVMVISGLLSVAGLFALYVFGVIGVVLAQPVISWHQHPVLITAALVATAAGIVTWLLLRRANMARAAARIAAEVPVAPVDQPRRRLDSVRTATRQALNAWRSLRVRDWSVAGLFAVANWLFDLLCLAATARAFDLPVGLITLSSIYLGVQIVRQVPLTPGGVGFVETGLLAGLVSAGGSPAAAAAVVLTYRVLSCWAFLPLGGLAWLGLRASARADS